MGVPNEAYATGQQDLLVTYTRLFSSAGRAHIRSQLLLLPRSRSLLPLQESATCTHALQACQVFEKQLCNLQTYLARPWESGAVHFGPHFGPHCVGPGDKQCVDRLIRSTSVYRHMISHPHGVFPVMTDSNLAAVAAPPVQACPACCCLLARPAVVLPPGIWTNSSCAGSAQPQHTIVCIRSTSSRSDRRCSQLQPLRVGQ